jgi:hypothetical protein
MHCCEFYCCLRTEKCSDTTPIVAPVAKHITMIDNTSKLSCNERNSMIAFVSNAQLCETRQREKTVINVPSNDV